MIEQGELTEMVAGVQLGDGLTTVFDSDLAGSDHEEQVAGLSLQAHDIAGIRVHRAHHLRDPVELGWQESCKQWYVTQELLQVRDHGSTLPRFVDRSEQMPTEGCTRVTEQSCGAHPSVGGDRHRWVHA